jgi:alginate O-acetyltransferase complex protein AlgI
MLFNSLHFLVYFPVVFVIFLLTPKKFKCVILVIASYYFYAQWKFSYLFLIVLSTAVDYFIALKISSTAKNSNKKIYLSISLIVNLGLLFIFKYFNFFSESFASIAHHWGLSYLNPHIDFLLPVGISFYTFQTLSYSIDVYHGKIRPEKNVIVFALYVSFFPQLVAGPIERASRLLPELKKAFIFDYNRFVSGLQLIVWGFFKKVVVADRVSVFVDQVYGNPQGFDGVIILLATYFFAFQIYCDFSGYSDIAIGVARIFGIQLMRNFERPYFSKSIVEFWRRWHISLSSWFRDYVYIPLGGNRGGKYVLYRNLIIVFLVSGLWHGANWTFIVWGAIHGICIILNLIYVQVMMRYFPVVRRGNSSLISKIDTLFRQKALITIRNMISLFVTFHIVVIGWIFFRASTVENAIIIIRKILFDWGEFHWNSLGEPYSLFIAILSILFMEILHVIERGSSIPECFWRLPILIRWGLYYTLILSILIFGEFNSNEFLYFQF